MSDSESSKPSNTIKILIIGDCNVGKTSLLTHYLKYANRPHENEAISSTSLLTLSEKRLSDFSYENMSFTSEHDEYKPTIEGNIYKAIVSVNAQMYTLSIADMPGNNDEEIYTKMRQHYYFLENNAIDVVLICFSLVDVTSYMNVALKWLPEVKQYFKEAPILLVGTKSDLKIQLKERRAQTNKLDQVANLDEKNVSISNITKDSNETHIFESTSINTCLFSYPPTPPSTPRKSTNSRISANREVKSFQCTTINKEPVDRDSTATSLPSLRCNSQKFTHLGHLLEKRIQRLSTAEDQTKLG